MNGNGKKRNSSAVFSCLSRFSEYIYSKIPNSLTAKIFTSKERTGLFSMLREKINFNKRVSLPVKRYLARSFDNSFVLGYLRELISKIPLIQLKCIGVFYFAFGLYTAVAHLLKTNLITHTGNVSTLILAIFSCVMGGIFSGSQKSCYSAFMESKILNGLFVKLLGIPKNDSYTRCQPIGKTNVFFLAGIIGGVIGSITSAEFVLLLFPALLAAYAILAFPESGAVALFLLLPFLTSGQTGIFSLLVAFSWVIKLMRGKRVFKFASLDIPIIAFCFAILFGGFISVSPKESTELSALMLTMLVGYFAVGNLLRTPEWIRRCSTALTVSFTLSLVFTSVGIVTDLLPETRTAFLDELMTTGLISLFSVNPLFIHLSVAVIPLIVYKAVSSKNPNKTTAAIIITAMSLLCVLIGRSRSAFISIAAGIVILLLLTSKKSFAYIIPTALAIPCIIALMPTQVTGAVKDIFYFDGAVSQYRQTVSSTTNKMVFDSFFGGIGLGDSAFQKIFPLYTNNSSQSISHAPDLYTQITLSLGVAGLVIFVVFIYKLLRRYFSYISQSKNDDSELRLTVTASFCGIVALLIMGFVDYIWHSPSVFMAFWLMVALFTSSARTAEDARYKPIPDGPTLEIDCAALKKRKDNSK